MKNFRLGAKNSFYKKQGENLRVVVHNLSKSYGFLWAVRKIDLELQPGECVALLGPNGAGKTTLLKLLSALLHPSAGEILIDGQRLHQGSSRLRSAIGLISPNEHLYEGLSAGENLRFFNALYGRQKRPRDVEDALKAVGLSRWSNDYVSSLSSGMKCRLAIAKWLLLEPQLLLLDEPYGVLDGSGVDLLETYLQRLRQNGGIVMMATHHVPRVLNICSRALILHQGGLIFDEPRQDPWESFHRAFADFLPRGERWTS